MLKKRLIPKLLVQNIPPAIPVEQVRCAVSSNYQHFKETGTLLSQLKIFEANLADEIQIIYVDSAASDPVQKAHLINEVTRVVSTPLAVGGSVRTLDEAKQLFDAGIEKLLLSFEPSRLKLVSNVSDLWGSQAVNMAVDYSIQDNVLTLLSGRNIGRVADINSVFEQIKEAGAGEVSLNNTSRDGSLSGPETEVLRELAEVSTIPVVVGSGIGSIEDFLTCYQAGADGVTAGSFFAFRDQSFQQVRNRLRSLGIAMRTA
jgi:cyclase